MTENAYSRAVTAFEAMMTAAEGSHHATPTSLIRAAGLASSTGYRHVAALEAEGLLRRDNAGVYLTGLTALRTGLRGFGLGALAPLADPILTQLRQTTQHTAFLAIAQDGALLMGPHSPGRATRTVPLERRYRFETAALLNRGEVTETALVAQDDAIARRIGALICPVAETGGHTALLGLLLTSARTPQPGLVPALGRAAAQIAGGPPET